MEVKERREGEVVGENRVDHEVSHIYLAHDWSKIWSKTRKRGPDWDVNIPGCGLHSRLDIPPTLPSPPTAPTPHNMIDQNSDFLSSVFFHRSWIDSTSAQLPSPKSRIYNLLFQLYFLHSAVGNLHVAGLVRSCILIWRTTRAKQIWKHTQRKESILLSIVERKYDDHSSNTPT